MLACSGEAVAKTARHAERVGNQVHNFGDFADEARADLVDALRGSDLGEIGLVDLFEIHLGQLAAERQRFVDDLVEGRILRGRVHVPDLEITRNR